MDALYGPCERLHAADDEMDSGAEYVAPRFPCVSGSCPSCGIRSLDLSVEDQADLELEVTFMVLEDGPSGEW